MSAGEPASVQAPRRLRDLPLPAQLYVCATLVLGASCAVVAVMHLDWDSPALLSVLLLAGLLSATLKLSLPLMLGRSSMSLSYAVVMFTLLVAGASAAVLVAVTTAFAQSIIRTRSTSPWYQRAFNAGSLAATVAAVGWAFLGLRDANGGLLESLIGPLGLAAVLYFAINTLFVAGAVALTTRQSLAHVWHEDFLFSGPGYFIGAAAAGLAFALLRLGAFWWVGAALPLYLTFLSYRTYMSRVRAGQAKVEEALRVQFSIVHSLAVAIESRDRTSRSELQRLVVCAGGLAEAIGLSTDDVHAVRTAALLHDVGNLAVPEHILAKPTALTFEEFQKVRIHTRVGAEILQRVPFPVPVAPMILSHHEHWDGSGYPSGLAGDAIPLGARILAVADCFSAVLSDRPYRKAFTNWEALATLRRSSGTVLDPTLVDRFFEILPELQPRLDAESPDTDSTIGTAIVDAHQDAFEDIAVARQEARALFEIAQSLTSTQTVAEAVETIVTKLGELIPITGGALFVCDEAQTSFVCEYATGLDTEVMTSLSGPTCEDVCARVERHARSRGHNATVLATELSIGDRLLGALVIVGADGASRDEHQRLLEHVSHQAAIIIQNAIAFEQTRQMSLTDQLTELPNRRYFMQHIEHEFARADRLGCPVALFMIDVNRFKEINDTYGHAVGDRLLCEIGRVMRSLLRPYDVCARYGGDEFVLALWDCDAERAQGRRAELEDAIAAGSVPVPGGVVAPCASVGVAVFPAAGRRLDKLMSAADADMYSRKMLRRTSALDAVEGRVA